MNWKYSLAIHGTVEQIKEFTKELTKIGYREDPLPYELMERVLSIYDKLNK